MANLLTVNIKSKSFFTRHKAVKVFDHIGFDVRVGEFISIVGPSGCGKSTLLRIISNLDKDFTGKITSYSNHMNTSFVFQNLGLFPWMSVYDNIRFAANDFTYIKQLLINISLWEFKDAWIKELSGGMKQRLALARGLVNKPNLLLLDEPLRELDMITKERIQKDIKNLLHDNATTTLLVTHDIDEAIYFSDRIIVLSDRPTTLKKIFNIDFDSEDRFSPEFQKMKADVKQELI